MPMVAVGNYDVTVGLQGNDEILEPLRIVMKVRGEAPNWTVNPDLYENSMSIVAQVYINGVLLSNSESRVAAFIDGECRGVAEIQPIRGSAFVALSVYGTAQQNVKNVMQNLDNGKSVTFRIWDAARGVTYTNVNVNVPTELVVGSPASIAFDPSMTYGNFDMPVIYEMDSVQWCTNQIKSWEKVLSDNEENKVKAMQSREASKAEPWNGWENFSIDGGSTYTYSVIQDTTKVHKDETTWYMGGILNNTWANSIKNFIHWGVVTKLSNEAGREQSDIDGVIHKNSMEWDYVISDGNPDTDLSIDKYPSNQAGYSDVFSLFGGQTYNPYEGKEYTKWFEPGKHVLSNGSEQMEQPDIRISTDGVNSAKEATLTDVPAGQSGQFTLFMSNKSNANRHYDPIFQIVLPDAFNQKGLNVQMDGLPLSSGHNILIPQGETVKKVIIVTQTDQSVLDYDSVSIVLASRFQPIEISDKVLLHTHFKPASSPIDLVVSEPVFNIETMQRTKLDL